VAPQCFGWDAEDLRRALETHRLPNMRLKLSARWRRLCRNAQGKPSFLPAAPAGRSLSATR